MTLEQATAALSAAIEAEDLGAVARALAERASAIEAGAAPTKETVEAGERAARAIKALKHKWALESARLSQLQSGFAQEQEREPFHDLVG